MCNKNICCENINICVQPTHAWGSSSVITAGVSTTGWCVTMLTLVGTIQMRCMAVSSTQVCRKSSSCKILMIARLCGRGGWGCSLPQLEPSSLPMWSEKVVCAASSLHLCILSYMDRCSVACHSSSCTPTSGILILELVMS